MGTPKKRPLLNIPDAKPVLAIDDAEPEVLEPEPAEAHLPQVGSARIDASSMRAATPPREREYINADNVADAEVQALNTPLARGAQRVLGLGATDEGAGAVETVLEAFQKLGNRIAPETIAAPVQYRTQRSFEGGEQALDPRTVYEQGRDRENAAHDKAEEEGPGSYLGGQIGGGILQSGPALFTGPAAAGWGSRALEAAKVAVPLAGITGFNESEEPNVLGRGMDALEAAEVAAVTAPVLGEVGHRIGKGLGKGYDAVRRFVGLEPPKAGAPPIREDIRAQYDGAGGPRIEAADKLTAPGASELRKLAMAGGSDEVLEGHTQAMRERLDELARGSTSLGPDLNDPKAQELAAARLRRDLEDLWPDQEQALRGADPQVIEQHARRAHEKVSQIWKATDVVKWEEDITSKGPLVSKLLKRDGFDPHQVQDEAQRVAGNVADGLEGLKMFAAEGTEDRNLITKLQKEASEFAMGSPSDMKWGFDSPYDEAGKVYLRLDEMKRQFQRRIASIREKRDSVIISEIEAIENMLRGHLEDASKWGDGVSALQQVRNRGWRDRLLLKSRKGDPDRLFLTDATGAPSADEYRPMSEGDPAGIARIIKNAGEFTGSNEIATLRRWAERESKLADALSDHIDPDPRWRAEAKLARRNADELLEILDTREREALAARGLEQPGPKLARDPAKLLAMVRSTTDFGSVDEVAALRKWLESQADQPFNDNKQRSAIRNVMALLDRAPAAPSPDNLGLKYAQDPDAIMAMLREGKASPELDQWLDNQAGNSERARAVVEEIRSLRTLRNKEAMAARMLGSIGKPAKTERSVIADAAGELPFGLGRLARTAAAAEPVDLAEQAAQLARLERVLEVDPDNAAAKSALRRLFAASRDTRIHGTPRTGGAAGVFTAAPSGQLVTEDKR